MVLRSAMSETEQLTQKLAGRGLDVTVPNVARMYNYFLGGKDHFPADRQAAEEVRRQRPEVVASAWANRAFLARAVRFLVAQCGIGQFVDIGTGLPAPANTHEVAQEVDPSCRVVYVDYADLGVMPHWLGRCWWWGVKGRAGSA